MKHPIRSRRSVLLLAAGLVLSGATGSGAVLAASHHPFAFMHVDGHSGDAMDNCDPPLPSPTVTIS